MLEVLLTRYKLTILPGITILVLNRLLKKIKCKVTSFGIGFFKNLFVPLWDRATVFQVALHTMEGHGSILEWDKFKKKQPHRPLAGIHDPGGPPALGVK